MTPREAVNASGEIVRRMRVGRELMGLTRVEIARLGGPSVNCLHSWERGRNRPTLIKLIQYADVLGWEVQLVKRVPFLGKVR